MVSVLASVTLMSAFATYPAFGDRPPVVPRAGAAPRIEATIDKGPILEMHVRCRRGAAIISYSKVERVYCSPQGRCAGNLGRVLAASCG